MEELKDESIHLVITSPPYPMIKKWDDLYGKIDFFYQHSTFLDPVWEECFRVLIPGGIACVNIGDATRTIDRNYCCYPNYAYIVMKFMELKFVPLVPILWKKISTRPNAFLGSGFLPPNAYISQDCEYIAVFRKGKLRKFLPKDKNRYRSIYTMEERNLWFSQVWTIVGVKGAKETSAFPEEVPRRLVQMFSIIGDIILDPFSGTGTTGNVAKKLEREFVGYEINSKKVGKQTYKSMNRLQGFLG